MTTVSPNVNADEMLEERCRTQHRNVGMSPQPLCCGWTRSTGERWAVPALLERDRHTQRMMPSTNGKDLAATKPHEATGR